MESKEKVTFEEANVYGELYLQLICLRLPSEYGSTPSAVCPSNLIMRASN